MKWCESWTDSCLKWCHRCGSAGLVVLTAMVGGCATDPTAFESLTGSFTGTFQSFNPSQNLLAGELALEVLQDEESITGTWSMTGRINDTTPTASMGVFSATIPLGPNPSFTIRMSYDFCPNDVMEFEGAYNSATGVMTLVGLLDVPSSQCSIVTVYPLDFPLTR